MQIKEVVLKAVNVLPPAAAYSATKFINAAVGSSDFRVVRDRVSSWYAKSGHPTAVTQGPFAGMKLAFRPITGPYALPALSRFFGTYELEIHPFVNAIVALKPAVFIDIGAADGFYAVGFARLLPDTRIIGFESSAASRYLLRTNHKLNGFPGRVDLRGRCDPVSLQEALSSAERPVIMCDVDGYEDIVIDPISVPHLAKCVMLVEVHDSLAPGVADRLKARFGKTHDIVVVAEQNRTTADKPASCPLSDSEFLDSVQEYRLCPGLWYFMTPRSG